LLAHKHDGLEPQGRLRARDAEEFAVAVAAAGEPRDEERGQGVMLRFDGQTHTDKKVDL